MKTVSIEYFSDVMCVWAYVAQVRLDELQHQFEGKIQVSYRYCSVYGNAHQRVHQQWDKRGGVAAYAKYVKSVADDFGHLSISHDFWQNNNAPHSSASVHCFLKAIDSLVQQNKISNEPQASFAGKTLYEEAIWQCRHRYFSQGLNIGELKNQLAIATDLNIHSDDVLEQMHSGKAFASLCEDNELKEKYKIEGSPTYVLNDGRQKLYGNVGYKIIAANIEELINRPQGVASWC